MFNSVIREIHIKTNKLKSGLLFYTFQRGKNLKAWEKKNVEPALQEPCCGKWPFLSGTLLFRLQNEDGLSESWKPSISWASSLCSIKCNFSSTGFRTAGDIIICAGRQCFWQVLGDGGNKNRKETVTCSEINAMMYIVQGAIGGTVTQSWNIGEGFLNKVSSKETWRLSDTIHI